MLWSPNWRISKQFIFLIITWANMESQITVIGWRSARSVSAHIFQYTLPSTILSLVYVEPFVKEVAQFGTHCDR